jgi:AraC-like DNA-binding protein
VNIGLLCSRLHFRDVEAERFKQVLDGANLEHTITGGQRGNAVVDQIHGPLFSIDHGRYTFPVVARGQFAPGHICIGIAEGECSPTWINGFATGRNNLQVYHEGADVLYRAGPNNSWAGLTVTRERLQAEARKRLGRELPFSVQDGMEHLRVDPTSFDRLTRLIRSLPPRPGRISRDAEGLGTMVIGAYVEAIASANSPETDAIRRRAAYRLDAVRRADAAMRSLIGTRYLSAQLCKELGMSERNLELYFHEALGVSPKAWFQHLALHRARTELLHRKPSRSIVTEVALDCGFEHFGRFSQAYRELFGELPSATSRAGENVSHKRHRRSRL